MTVEEVLQTCVAEGKVVKITSQQLDRKVYEGVKKKLEGIGGKWKGGKVQGFEFPYDPTELLAEVQGGKPRNLKKEFQFFPTPPALADQLVALAKIDYGMRILEPSAGEGAIIKAIQKSFPGMFVFANEINPIQIDMLKKMPNVLVWGDFLEMKYPPETEAFDRIVANPPFAKNQDIDHVLHMWKMLKRGGRIVTIVSTHWEISSNKKETDFRNWLDVVRATKIDVPAGTFKESGTNVPTRILVINKEA